MEYEPGVSGVYEVAGPTLTEIIGAIISQEDPVSVLAAAVSKCGALVRADGALVVVHSAVGSMLRGAGGATHSDVREVGTESSTGIAGAVAFTRQPLLVADVGLDARYDASVDAPAGTTPRSLIAVPLLAHSDLLGVLLVVRSKARRPFMAPELDLLATVAPHVAIAVFNALTVKRLTEAQAAASATQADLELKVQKRTSLLVKAKREWESTVDAISEPLALLKGMTVARANLAYGQKAGVAIRDVPGRKCFELLAHSDVPCAGCPVIELQQGREARQVELRMGPLHLQVSTFPTGEDDGSVVVHYRDVTEQRGLEARLRHSERLASLGQLASGAAHEINNPLGFVISNLRSIAGMLGELPSGGTVSELQEAAADALEGAERVSAIVRGLRAMARQHVGAIETLSLEDAAKRAISAVMGSGASQVITDFSLEARAAAVPLLLDQALGNLLTNARQAVKNGGKIRVSTGLGADEAWVRVVDEGTGIAPADLPRIFEPFFTTRGVGGGVGLGLTAVWSIVTGLGGHVDVESSPGRGSSFTVRLPRVVSSTSGVRADFRSSMSGERNLAT